MENKVNEENGRGGTQENGICWKLQRFSRNEFWKNIGCIISAHTFGLGGSRLWEKDQNISGKNRKRYLIQSKVDLYENVYRYFKLFIMIIISILILIFLPPDLWHLSH